MAFLTDNNWYQVTFLQTNDVAWGALSSFPSIPAALLSEIVAGNAVLVYVTNSAAGAFSFYGGGVSDVDDTVLTAIPAPLSSVTTTSDSGPTFSSVITTALGVDTWWTWDATVGVLKYADTEAAALKAFLP